jgi:diamine N-acetyltransferase
MPGGGTGGSRTDNGHVAAHVELREITDDNRDAVCAVRVRPDQKKFVASVKKSLKEARKTPQASPWYRAVYADDVPVGFVMLSWAVPPGTRDVVGSYYLWRLLVGAEFQGRGYGRAALTKVIELVKADGGTELFTSYQPGKGEPWPFYRSFGFQPTGEIDDGEIVLRLALT